MNPDDDHRLAMTRRIRVIIISAVMLVIGLLIGRETRQPPEPPTLAICSFDVQIVDAAMGMPVNTKMALPDGFSGVLHLSESSSRRLPGKSYGPFRSEHEPETGRWRFMWIGYPDADYQFRFTADGYLPLVLPTELIQEVMAKEVDLGVSGATVLEMKPVKESSREEDENRP